MIYHNDQRLPRTNPFAKDFPNVRFMRLVRRCTTCSEATVWTAILYDGIQDNQCEFCETCERQKSTFKGLPKEIKDRTYALRAMNIRLEQLGMPPACSFTYYSSIIIDPFVDESMTTEVDPVRYYAEFFLQSRFVK